MTEGEILSRFEECWEELKGFYTKDKEDILAVKQAGGTPSLTIWSEADLKFRLARICADKFGVNRIHLEVKMRKERNPIADLVITDPNEAKELIRKYAEQYSSIVSKQGNTFRASEALETSNSQFDLIAEIALILTKDKNNEIYGYGKLLNNLKSLRDIRQKTKTAALCFIDKISEGIKSEFYKEVQSDASKHNISLFCFFDSSLQIIIKEVTKLGGKENIDVGW